MAKQEIRAETQIKGTPIFKGITTKQWQVYYYMLNMSNFDKDTVENHRYLYKNKLNISQASKFLHISRPTIYKAIENLKKCKLIEEQTKKYLFYNYNWININKETLTTFINQTELNTEKTNLLRIYLILKKMDSIAECLEDRCFTKRDLILLLGHSDTRSEYYEQVRDYIGLLVYYGLIEVKIHTEYDPQFGKYTIYHLQKVNGTSNNPDFFMNLNSEQAHKVVSEKMREQLTFTQPGLLA